MRNVLIVSALAYGLYQYIVWTPSAIEISRDIEVGEEIQFQGKAYTSAWADQADSIEAYVRRIDRHYDENFPIITYDFVLTTGDFNDPDIVSIRHKGGGNYYWSSKVQPTGTLVAYHLIPESPYAQGRIDKVEEGDTITMIGKISKDSKITSSTGRYLQLVHDNHKFILVDDASKIF